MLLAMSRTEPPYSMTEEDVIHCPMCDVCVSTTGRPFESSKSVIAHIVSSHEGYGYEEASAMMEDTTREASSSENQSDNDKSDTMENEGETSITFEEPSGGKEAVENSGDKSEKVDLPCEHESYDPSKAPEKPFKLSCDECGETWRVEE